jgi:hypothetical protein
VSKALLFYVESDSIVNKFKEKSLNMKKGAQRSAGCCAGLVQDYLVLEPFLDLFITIRLTVPPDLICKTPLLR